MGGAFAVVGRGHAPQLAPAAQAQVQRGVAAEDGALVARAIEARVQHGQQGVVAPPLGTFVDAPQRRPPGAREGNALHPGQQLLVDGSVVRAQRIGRQQRLWSKGLEEGVFGLRAAFLRAVFLLGDPGPLRLVLLQRRLAFLRLQQGQPGLVRQIARGLAGAALRERLQGHRRAAIAQAPDEVGQAVVEQIVPRAQQCQQAWNLGMQQALGGAAACGVRILGQPPHQPGLLARGHQPPGAAVQAFAQGGNGAGLQGRLRQAWRHRGLSRGRAGGGRRACFSIQLRKALMGLQHIARAQALAQVGQRSLACRLQRLGQGGERAVIDLRDDAGLQLRDLQGHDMARCGGRGVAARHLQGQHPHGADAFVASLWPGQCGVSKQIHAAGIQCFSMEGVGVRRRCLAIPGRHPGSDGLAV